jgi:hypothetical protein
MKFGEAQAEQICAPELPNVVVWMPKGWAQVALHWLIDPFK